MPDVKFKRGTRASLASLVGSNGLDPFTLYVLTDANDEGLVLALTNNTYIELARKDAVPAFVDAGSDATTARPDGYAAVIWSLDKDPDNDQAPDVTIRTDEAVT